MHLMTRFLVGLLFSMGVAAEAGDLSGAGEWRSVNAESVRGRWSTNLVRTGEEVSGSFSLEGSNVFRNGRVTGRISGQKILLGVMAEGETAASFTGSLTDDGKISGEWECAALNDHGVWEGALGLGAAAADQ